jgi:hypothetical protein
MKFRVKDKDKPSKIMSNPFGKVNKLSKSQGKPNQSENEQKDLADVSNISESRNPTSRDSTPTRIRTDVNITKIPLKIENLQINKRQNETESLSTGPKKKYSQTPSSMKTTKAALGGGSGEAKTVVTDGTKSIRTTSSKNYQLELDFTELEDKTPKKSYDFGLNRISDIMNDGKNSQKDLKVAQKIQSIQHQSTYLPKVDKFDLNQINASAGREQEQVIYKSLIKQPFFDKIVKEEYFNSKTSRRKSFANMSDLENTLITGAIEKVDYKDFGHYVEDCKKHYALAKELEAFRQKNGGGPSTLVQVKLNRSKCFSFLNSLFSRIQKT